MMQYVIKLLHPAALLQQLSLLQYMLARQGRAHEFTLIPLSLQRSCDSNVLAVDPTMELRFLFEPRKDVSCCLQLTNMTDGFLAFNIKIDKTKYTTQPSKGMIPPCSKRYVSVTLLAQDDALPSKQCNDMFLVQSANVGKDLTTNEINEDFFKEAMKGKVVDVVKLPIVYVALDQISCS